MKGKLILQDGSVFEGNLFGDTDALKVGEVVFNTSMTGYQEVLTDPSYYGQIVVMTYPLIGNYGINAFDDQSNKIQVKGFVVREMSDLYSNWESDLSLDSFLKKENIVLLEGVDTRAITQVIRNKKAMNGKIIQSNNNMNQTVKEINNYTNKQPVYAVTTKQDYVVQGLKKNGIRVAVIDFGIKENILKNIKMRVQEMKIFNAGFKAEAIVKYNPTGLFLSNGPGDPETLTEIIENLKPVIEKYPTFGICLGHQLIALIYGLETRKMTFGHRGGNHPVINKKTNKVFISSQNHGYEVIGKSGAVEVIYENVNDKTIEGLSIKNKDIFSVQFHPEASPGPHDSLFLFDEFIKMMAVT